MNKNFADWYQPVTFGHDRETLELRWKGVEKAVDNVDLPMIFDLTRLVYGYPVKSETFNEDFREYFKEIDQTFKITGNDQEVMVLGGCVLALLCDEYDTPEAPLSILTTSACGTRRPKIEIDLVKMANKWILKTGISTRKREEISNLTNNISLKALNEAIKTLTESPDLPHAVESLKIIGSYINKLIDEQKKLSNGMVGMEKLLKIQDEELQILWWMVSGWSIKWDARFDDIDIKCRPIMLAKEAAFMTNEPSEPPSIKPIFSRIGITEDTELTIPEAINACGVDNLKKLQSTNSLCSTIFPLHFAMLRALETGANSAWISAWNQVVGIKKTKTVTALDLAVQAFREHKLMILAGADHE